MNEIGVGFSRDGFQWERPTRGNGDEAFISASNSPDAWDGYNTQSAGGGFMVVGDELWFYFSGRSERKPESGIASTGLAKLRRDGFYSMDASSTEGTLTTRPIQFSGDRLFVNVNNPQGELRVEILDSNGDPIGPYTKANSIPVSIDKTLHEIQWNGAADLSSLAGQAVQFRFHLTDGELYSFWVSSEATGASGGYVAAGGPGFTDDVDTVGTDGYTPSTDASPDTSEAVDLASEAYVEPAPLLDIESRVVYAGDRGLHAVAFHPDFGIPGAGGEGKLYVHYSGVATLGGDHDSVIAEFTTLPNDPTMVDPDSERILLRINQPFEDNNGGGMAFGPDDGLLYLLIGDGGGNGDPGNHAQDLSSLLGKVLRIDVDGTDGPGGEYGIPATNPFVGQAGSRAEIFAFGFQDPRQLSFDDGANGASSPDRIFVVDAGTSQRHEVNLVTAAGNYGWPRLEGSVVVKASVSDPGNMLDPITEYAIDTGPIVGGLVNRSPLLPDEFERYLFADWNGRLSSLSENAGVWTLADEGPFGGQPIGENILGFGSDESGSVYVSTYDTVYRVAGSAAAGLTVGTYGILSWNIDGNYSYQLDSTNAELASLASGSTLVESFEYEVTDGDGNTDTAALTITITTDALFADLHPLNVFENKLDGQWQGSVRASDGKIYFASSTHAHDAAALFFQYEPGTGSLTQIGSNLSQIAGEDPATDVPQGKLHSPIIESNGWLYMATHLGNYWSEAEDAYTGSHLIGYELGSLESGQPNFIDFGIPLPRYTTYSAVAVSPDGQYLWSIATPWASADAATSGSHLFRTEIATGVMQDYGPLMPDNDGSQSGLAMHVDNRGDAWITVLGGQDQLFVGRAATGTIDVFDGALPAMTDRNDPNELSAHQDASWWHWGHSIDGERFVFTIRDSQASGSDRSGGSLWEFDASKTLDGDLSDAFRQLAWIGGSHLGMTYSEGTVYFVRRNDGDPNPKINAVQGGGEYWEDASDTGERLHLYSVRINDPDDVITDWGMITDSNGRIPWRIESLSADASSGEIYLTGDWVMLEGDPVEWRTLRHGGDVTPSYALHIRGQAFAVASLPAIADVAVTVTQDATEIIADAALTYTVVIANDGPSAVTDTTVSVAIPPSLLGVTWTATGSDGAHGFDVSGVGSIDDATIRLPAGATVTYLVQGTVDAATPVGTPISVSASVFDAMATELDATNNSASVTSVVKPSSSDLSITVNDTLDPVLVGDDVTYQLSVTNNGLRIADQVVVAHTLPANVIVVSTSSPCVNESNTVVCELGDLAVDATVNLEVVVTSTEVGEIVTSATVTSDVEDPDASNNTAGQSTTVNPLLADLSVTLSDSTESLPPGEPLLEGDPLVYYLTVTNNGPRAAHDVVLVDSLASSVNFVSASIPCSHEGGVVTCGLGTLESGQSVNLQVDVLTTAYGSIENSATVTSSTTDPVTSNNAAQQTTLANQLLADVAVTITNEEDRPGLGEEFTYQLTVENNGPHTAADVVLTQTLPAGVTVVSATAPCVAADEIVTCGLGDLDAGDVLMVNVVASHTEPGPLLSSVTVTSDTADPNSSNNSASQLTTVLGPSGSTDIVFVSFTNSGNVADILYADEDILALDTSTGQWSLYFDGSKVIPVGSDLDAFHIQADGSILLSFDGTTNVSGLGWVRDSDIVQFNPTAHGVLTAGSFEWFLDGSDVGLGASSGDVDAISFTPAGELLISVPSTLNLSGLSVASEDLLVLENGVFGPDSSGDWALYFDGSDSGLGGDNVWGSSIDANTGDLYLTTRNGFSLDGARQQPQRRWQRYLAVPAALARRRNRLLTQYRFGR